MSTPADAGNQPINLSSHDSPALSVEIRASYELGRMLGSGEVVRRLSMSWDELLNHGHEPFDLAFPLVRGVHPSIELQAAIVHAGDDRDDALFGIARDTDAGHIQFTAYMTSKTVSPERHCRALLLMKKWSISLSLRRPNCTTISGDKATRAGALEALQQNTWMHLACHGKQDPTQPYGSHFVVRDEHLTLLDIMEKHLLQAEFAFLSACRTAVGDAVLSVPTISRIFHPAPHRTLRLTFTCQTRLLCFLEWLN
ncbi:hypothetical protein BDR06DRAFT_1013013 [Suillus hirtellus]|nr:hypothetical protein BDR06DRAFT_1013013 [Suillus hirtellus]